MEEKLLFQKLTPLNDGDISVYEEAIDFVFANADVKNVAISGAYGAGKSSVLETYKKKHSEHSFLHILLAHFQDTEHETKDHAVPIKESVLEGKILNQLIHQIPTSKIPQTNFKVKKQVEIWKVIGITALLSVLMGGFAYLFLFNDILAFIMRLDDGWIKSALSVIFHPHVAVVVAVVCVISSVVGIYWLIQQQKNKGIFHKISLKGNEIELFADQDDSFFDKYLNEVLYLFDSVEEDVVVFEDMDRFNASQIFERLREVNALVNIRRKKKAEQGKYVPLRFFYLLRDDIFETKDRTKFFDYIIPIVPVVDGSNSYEKFVDLLRKANLLQEFDLSFLQGLCLYIDDMRVLKNIYNEFIVYFNRLNKTALNCNKMMAIVAYKNLFPRDCSELQLGRGFVAMLFEHKGELSKEMERVLQQERQQLLERLERAKKEHLESEEEIDVVYDEKIRKIREKYIYSYSNEGKKETDKAEQERTARKQAVLDRLLENQQQRITAQMHEVERKIEAVTSKRLKNLITRENADVVFALTHKNEIGEEIEFEDVKSNHYFDLLKFLIRNGYIDETYSDYMTYFYEGSISQTDKIFLRRITDRCGADYTYELKEPQKIVESPLLRVEEFWQEETLNFDLLECLLQNAAKQPYAKYLDAFLGQLKETENFDFVSRFYDAGRMRAEYVVRLNKCWPEFFAVAQKEGKITPSQLHQFSVDTLCCSETNVIEQVNVGDCLTTYISEKPDYLDIKAPDIERLIAGFLTLKVSFVNIDCEKSEKNLFREVYKHSLYVLSFENIELMLRQVYGIGDAEAITCKNYTVIHSDSESPLAEYVDVHLSEYLKVLLKHCSDNCELADEAVWAIRLLNSETLSVEEKSGYIAALATEISDIGDVADDSLWGQLLDRECVALTVPNLVRYFVEHGLDEHLIGYINSLPAGLSYATVEGDFGKETEVKLYKAVASCNGIENRIYQEIVTGLGYYFTDYSNDELADEKVEILIEQGLVRMDEDALGFIREKHSGQLYIFIRKNFEKYLEVEAREGAAIGEVQEILAWQIDIEQRKALLKLTDESISIVGRDSYPDAITAYILENNYEPEDIAWLCAKYSRYGEETRKLIVSQCESQLSEILAEETAVEETLLSVLLALPNIDEDDKVRLFANALPTLNEETCKRHFEELGVPELRGIFAKRGGRRNYENSTIVTGILDALKQHGWIYEYHEDESDPGQYRVLKNRPKQEKMVD